MYFTRRRRRRRRRLGIGRGANRNAAQMIEKAASLSTTATQPGIQVLESLVTIGRKVRTFRHLFLFHICQTPHYFVSSVWSS